MISHCAKWLGLLLGLALTNAAPAQRLVIFVRHAEKEAGTGDVSLSAIGKKRAEELANVLKYAGIDSIVTSNTMRTKQTAEPLASLLKLTPIPISVQETPEQLKRRLSRDHGKQCVLIVGHSNLIPGQIDALAGQSFAISINENQYDGLFVLTPKPDGRWSLVRAKF